LGNDFDAIHIESQKVYDHVKAKGAEKGPETSLLVRDPDGHKFYIYPGETEYPVKRVSLNVSHASVYRIYFTFLGSRPGRLQKVLGGNYWSEGSQPH
jgi:hypothetical protein